MRNDYGPSIRGGLGMSRVNLDQLDAAAAAFHLVADQIRTIQVGAGRASLRLQSTSSASFDSYLYYLGVAREVMEDGPMTMAALARRAESIADRLVAVRDHYTGADAEARWAAESVRRRSSNSIVPKPLMLLRIALLLRRLAAILAKEFDWVSGAQQWSPDVAQDLDSLVGDLGELLGPHHATMLVMALAAGYDQHSVSGLIGPMLARATRASVGQEVYSITARPTTPRYYPTDSIAGLIRRTGENHSDGDATAPSDALVIQVDKIRKADGTTAYTVILPGMDLGGDPAHPLDVQAVLALVGGDQTVVQRAIDDALEQAGATSLDPVMLVGHSGGGMAAASFASSGMGRKYNLKAVVTAGSPTAGIKTPPPGVEMLNLENKRDLVIGADSGETAAALNRLTFSSTVAQLFGKTLPTAASPDPHGGALRTLFDNHRSEMYARIGQEFEATKGEMSIDHMKSVIAEFTDVPGARVETTEFEVRNTPVAESSATAPVPQLRPAEQLLPREPALRLEPAQPPPSLVDPSGGAPKLAVQSPRGTAPGAT